MPPVIETDISFLSEAAREGIHVEIKTVDVIERMVKVVIKDHAFICKTVEEAVEQARVWYKELNEVRQ